MTNLFLFFHLLGAFCFFAGGAVVGVVQLAAIRQARPSQVHAYLRLAPFGAALVGTGALLTLGFGIALAEHEDVGFSPAWIQAALGLWVAAMVLGAYGGRTARHARHLAEKLAAEGDAPDLELRLLVGARGPLYASYASFALLLAIVGLMVWQPGNPPEGFSIRLDAVKPLSFPPYNSHPHLAVYFPARLPAGFHEVSDNVSSAGVHIDLAGDRGAEVTFGATKARCSMMGRAMHTFVPGGIAVAWSGTTKRQTAWRCVDGGVLSASASVPGNDSFKTPAQRRDALNLAMIVAYAKPIN